MKDMNLILESLSLEQYISFFNGLPIYSPSIKLSPEEFISYFSKGNESVASLLKNMINNKINITNVKQNSEMINIEFIINKEDINFLKKIKDLNLSNNSLFINDKETYRIEICLKSLNELNKLKLFIENYFAVNKIKECNEQSVFSYIEKVYSPIDEQYLKYIETINKDKIAYLREKKRQENFQFDSLYLDETIDVDSISIKEIYDKFSEFSKFKYDNLTDDMKRVMCNKFFEQVFKSKIKLFLADIKSNIGKNINIKFFKQLENTKDEYGISGNLPPFENDNIDINVFLNGNLKLYNIDSENVTINYDLLGQILITILHEYRHILQRLNLVDPNLTESISNFESMLSEDDNYYVDNYSNDPAEIDSNLYSISTFNNLASKYGIKDPIKILQNYVKTKKYNASENMNMYKDIDENNIEEIFSTLNEKLLNSIDMYLNINYHK